MLGLGGSMCMEDGIIQSATPTESLFDIPNLIGWWDFTDQATMWTAKDLGGINPGLGTDFRSIINKSSHPDRLGNHLNGSGTSISGYNAFYNDNTGNLSTDLNYARFIATSPHGSWRYSAAKLNSSESGVAESGIVSNANIDLQDFSFFAVIQPEAVDPGSYNRRLFWLNGKDTDGSVCTFTIGHEADDPNDVYLGIYMADEPSPSNRLDSVHIGENVLASKHLVSFNSGTGTNAARSYINGVEKSQATIDGDDVLTLDDNYATVMIGNTTNAFGIPGGPDSYWRGNIWEIIFYNQSLTSDQLTFVHNLIMERHGLT